LFRDSWVLWIANKHLSAVLYDDGQRDRKLPGTIMAKEVLGAGELSFKQEVHILRRRSRKEAAYIILVETACAWSVAGNERFANYCLQSAKRLLHIFFAEEEPERKMKERFDLGVAERIAE
jgi:hypothetical protein